MLISSDRIQPSLSGLMVNTATRLHSLGTLRFLLCWQISDAESLRAEFNETALKVSCYSCSFSLLSLSVNGCLFLSASLMVFH